MRYQKCFSPPVWPGLPGRHPARHLRTLETCMHHPLIRVLYVERELLAVTRSYTAEIEKITARLKKAKGRD